MLHAWWSSALDYTDLAAICLTAGSISDGNGLTSVVLAVQAAWAPQSNVLLAGEQQVLPQEGNIA